ncbi:hypothetical protein [Maribacter sp. R86514]|uniref:hypothetical protein n=1 Tax=Maribacter sp. R86514 TaxID=3093854 RepID=UPI0037C95401
MSSVHYAFKAKTFNQQESSMLIFLAVKKADLLKRELILIFFDNQLSAHVVISS